MATVDTLITNAALRIDNYLGSFNRTAREVFDEILSRTDDAAEQLNEQLGDPDFPERERPTYNRPTRGLSTDNWLDDTLPDLTLSELALSNPTNPTDLSTQIPDSPTLNLDSLFQMAAPDSTIPVFDKDAPEFKLPSGDMGAVQLPGAAPDIVTNDLFAIDQPEFAIAPFNEPTPTLQDVQSATTVVPDIDTTINLSGLFQQVAPTVTLDTFNEADPNFNIDALADEIAAIAKPVLATYDFPVISDLALDAVPDVEIPDFLLAETPEGLGTPDHYGELFEQKFGVNRENFKGYIDDRIGTLLNQLAPEYQRLAQSLASKLIDDTEALPDDYEQALYNRAVLRAKQELLAAEEAILEQHSKRGFVAPPGSVNAALNRIRYQSADALTSQATEIYAKRREMEVQHRQFILSQTAAQVDSVRNFVTQQSQLELAFLKTCADVTASALGFYVQTFEHLAKRTEIQVRIMDALNAHYDTKLKAAFAELERFKVYLSAEQQKSQVEALKIQAIESSIRAKNLEISGYQAMVQAITQRAQMEDLKLKHFQTKAELYRTHIQAQVASYDVYKTQIDGDKAKLQGELAKLDAAEKQLQAAGLRADIEFKNNQSIQAHNQTQMDKFRLAVDAYKARIQMQAAAFDVYKAALAGDSEKLKGRLSALQVYEMQLRSAGLQVDIQRNIDASIAEYNKALSQKFDAESRNYEIEIKAKLAAFEIYKAALSGDSAKLEAELAKVKVFDSQVRAEGLKIDVQKLLVSSVREYNEVQLQKYKADSTLYSLSLDAALKRFSARVEKEKLSNDAYRSDIDAEKTRFVAEMDMLKTDKLLSLEEYKARIDVLIKQSELLLRQLGPLAQVGSQHIQSAGGVAQAAANSLNTMVSLSETGA